LVLVKAPEAQRTYERAFFFASSTDEFYKSSEQMIHAGTITEAGLKKAVIEEFVMGTQSNFNYFYSILDQRLELLGTDTRRQTNLDGILRLPASQQLEALKYIDVKAIEAGHISCTVKESLLEQIFDLGEKFVRVARQEYPPGIIGPFALQSAFIPGPPSEKAIVFDISMRVQGSPGTMFTPYSGYYYGKSLSVGKRVAMELKKAIQQNRLEETVT
jgi:5-formaminoimidazole-4-carboxamide-1-(beta)-D-ribofuranosyl 5'-monophosphate synthetase